MSDSLIMEIEEAIRRERFERLWKEYGGSLITGIVLSVLFTALIIGWRAYNTKINRAETSAIIEALDSEDPAAALMRAESGLRPEKKTLARLTVAGQFVSENKFAEAQAQYAAIAGDKDAPAIFSDFAQIMTARLAFRDAASAAQADVNATLDALGAIAASKDSPWAPLALLEAAGLRATQLGEYEKAQENLKDLLAMPGIPASVADRARALSHVYSIYAQRGVEGSIEDGGEDGQEGAGTPANSVADSAEKGK